MLDIVHKPLLDIRDLSVEFATRRGTVTAVRNIDINVDKGETLGIVGESGSGKSTVARCVARLVQPTSGAIRIDDTDIASMERG